MSLSEVVEMENEVVVQVGFLGVEKEDIDVAVEEGVLQITGQVKEAVLLPSVSYGAGFTYGSAKRAFFSVGDGLDTSNISAEYKNGLLTVTIPKRAKKVTVVEVK